MKDRKELIETVLVSVFILALIGFLFNSTFNSNVVTTYPPIVLDGTVRNTTQYNMCSNSCWKLSCIGPNDCLMQDCLNVCKLQDKGQLSQNKTDCLKIIIGNLPDYNYNSGFPQTITQNWCFN